jgi:hypothetical protein
MIDDTEPSPTTNQRSIVTVSPRLPAGWNVNGSTGVEQCLEPPPPVERDGRHVETPTSSA